MQLQRCIALLLLCSISSNVAGFGNTEHEMEYRENEEGWAELDDEIEAREEEYSRGRRQITVDRGETEKEQERVKPSDTLDCPFKCSCPAEGEVHCTFRFLPKIPEDLPITINKLNLGYNKLASLPPHVFDKFAETLKILYLHSNDIGSISNNVFSKMNKVEVLRLSWNKITGIRKVALHGLHHVERLYLDNNRLSFIHPTALMGLVNLKLLQLHGNRLSRLHDDVFVTVQFQKYFKFSSIQYLYLSKNEFKYLPRRLFAHMSELKTVYLHNNEWQCSCDLQWLKRWIEDEDKYRCKRNAWNPRAPQECAKCSWPATLSGLKLGEIPHQKFTCDSPRFNTEEDEGRVTYQVFQEENSPEEVERQSEVILFHYSDFYSSRLNIRLDNNRRSVFHADCHLTRVPVVKVKEVDEKTSSDSPAKSSETRSYLGFFDAQMECGVEYPQNSSALKTFMTLYLDRVMNLTSGDLRKAKSGEMQTVYSISLSSPPDPALATPLTGGSISSQSPFMYSSASQVLFHSSFFRPEERSILMHFQTTHHHTHVPKLGQYTRKPWVLVKQPKQTVTSVVIGVEKKTSAFKCKVVGQPRPEITWVLPGDRVLRAGESEERFSVSRSGRLFIRKAYPGDTGVYRCIATVSGSQEKGKPSENDDDVAEVEGVAEAEISSLRFVVFPRIDGESTLKKSDQGYQIVEEGAVWSSNCRVQSLPNSTVAWINPDNQLLEGQGKGRSGRVITTAKGRITIKGFERSDQGIYRCVAANNVGSGEYSIHVGMFDNSGKVDTVEIPDIVDLPDVMVVPSNPMPETTPEMKPVDRVIPSLERVENKGEELKPTPPPIIQPLPDVDKNPPPAEESTTPSPEIIEEFAEVVTTDKVNVSITTQGVTETDHDDATTTASPTEVPTITDFVENEIKVNEGETLTIPCNAVGKPDPGLKWIVNGKFEPIPSQPKPPAIDTDSTPSALYVASLRPGLLALIIDGITLADSGVYTCIAENIAGSRAKSVEVRVSEKKTLEKIKQELDIRQFRVNCEEDISFPCSLYPDFDPATIQWVLPDGSTLPVASSNSLGVSVSDNATLTITGASPRHRGMYKCEINNPRDYAFMSSQVRVRCTRPHISEPSDWKKVVNYGSEIRLNCVAEGHPEPSVGWKSPIAEGILEGNALVIEAATINASYECMAANSYGNYSYTVHVLVKTISPRLLPALPASVSALNGLQARLDCKAEGVPEPSYTWYFPDGSEIDEKDLPVQMDNGSLLIHKVSPKLAGQYSCTADNGFGTVRMSVRLVVIVPSTPSKVLGTPSSEKDIINGKTTQEAPKEQTSSTEVQYIDPVTHMSKYENFTMTPKYFPRPVVNVSVVTRRRNPAALLPKVDVQEAPTKAAKVFRTSPVFRVPPIIKYRDDRSSEYFVSTKYVKPTSIFRRTAHKRRRWPPADQPQPDTRAWVEPYRRKKIFEYSNSVYGMQGSKVVLPCKAELPVNHHGSRHFRSMPDITWTLPSGLIYMRQPTVMPGWKYYIYTNGSMAIRSLSPENAGHYKCIAVWSSENTEMRTHVTLHVQTIPPRILERLVDYEQTKPNDVVTFNCSSRGNPTPQVMWTTPTGLSLRAGEWRDKYTVYANGTLSIDSIEDSESGQYICTATNVVGEARRVVHLRVTSFPPRFLHPKTRFKYSKVGAYLRIPCSASGSPAPTMTWTMPDSRVIGQNQAVFQGSMRAPKHAVLRDGTLLINRATTDDAGRYYCTAENALGRDSALVYIRVYP